LDSTPSGSQTIADSKSGGVAIGYSICSLRERRKTIFGQSPAQETHHHKHSFVEELKELLKASSIESDEKYLL
jgi:hypothetical protein